MKAPTTPTILNLLASMPPEGTETHESRLQTYATMGHYYNGTDYQKTSVRAVRKLITEMDTQAGLVFDPTEVAVLEDDTLDRFGFSSGGSDYWFDSPSIANMPKRSTNLPKYYRECIDKLAMDPEAILGLPYLAFSSVSDALGKSLGLS